MGKNKFEINKNNIKYREYMIKRAGIYKISIFFATLLVIAFISLLIPLRPELSYLENRKLTEFPKLTYQNFNNGKYFEQLTTWFADTFPFRDSLMSCNERLIDGYGFRNNSLHGKIVTSDEIPDTYEVVDDNQTTDNLNIEEVHDSAEIINASDIGMTVDKTDDSEVARQGDGFESVYVVADAAYNYYFFSKNASDLYIDTVNQFADLLPENVKFYDMIVPTSIDIALDDTTRNSLSSSNQKKAIQYMYSRMSANVKKTNVYDTLKLHRDEYLYFRTDHHWTALGAYYAYTTFALQNGLMPNTLSNYEEQVFSGFIGTFATMTGSKELSNNPDTIYTYKPQSTNLMEMMDSSGTMRQYSIITDVSNWKASSKYSTFIGGDNPFTHISDSKSTNSSACLVIKESYGNAFAPYLVDHYKDVYVIDYRYYDQDITEFIKDNNIDTVLLLNNISATSSIQRVTDMQKVLK